MPQFAEDGTYVVETDEKLQEWQYRIYQAQEKVGRPLTSEEVRRVQEQYMPGYSVVSAPEDRGIAQRFSDAFNFERSAGGRGENAALARAVNDGLNLNSGFQTQQFPDMTPEQREVMRDSTDIREAREARLLNEMQNTADPAWKEDGTFVGNIARVGADILGETAANINPSYLLGAGRTLLGRAMFQGGVNAGIDAAVQGTENVQGLREGFDPLQTTMQFAIGAAMQGGSESVVRYFRGEPSFISSEELNIEAISPQQAVKTFQLEELWEKTDDAITDNVEAVKGIGRDNQGEYVVFEMDNGADLKMYQNTPNNPEEFDGKFVELDNDAIEGNEVAERLTQELQQAARLNKEQQAIYRAERSQRAAELEARQNESSGEAGFNYEKQALAGQFDRVDFEGVRDKFSQEEIDSLFNQIRDSDAFSNSVYNSVSARTGLQKLLEGTVPTASELGQLQKVFPPGFVQAALDKRAGVDTVRDGLSQVLNIPRALMSSFDLSAPLRQGLPLIGRRQWWGSFARMFHQFGSERAFNAVESSIMSRPNYDLGQRSGLSLTQRDGIDLTVREEDFQTDLAKQIPLLGRGVAASERAYVGFLNKLRADTFDSMVNDMKKLGYNPDNPADAKIFEDIASYVNSATGRGPLGSKTLEESAPILNATFFSPRLMASRIALLNPEYYRRMSAPVRQQALRDMLTMGSVVTGALTLAHEMGYDVELDPRSSDFGKVRDGTTRHDIMGGFGQYLTLAARLSTLSTKSVRGDEKSLIGLDINQATGEPYQDSVGSVGMRFLRSKLSPLASFAADAVYGENVVGEEFDIVDSSLERVTPFFLGDLAEVYSEEGVEGIPQVLPSAFGVGYADFEQVPVSSDLRATDNPTINAMEAVGARPTIQTNRGSYKINGTDFKPTDQEFEQYRQISESLILERGENIVNNPQYQELSDEQKQEILLNMQRDTRAEVRNELWNVAN